jgi:hypothetical protein
MNFHHSAILLSLALGLAATAACGSDGDGDGGGNGNGSGGGGNVACVTDYSTLASEPPVSFKDDILPIFGLSCAGSDQCHNSVGKKAELFLGDKCTSDPAAKWKCSYPTPVPQTTIDQVHAALMGMSATAPAVPLVVPSNPEGSFLMDKLADKQNDKGFTCEKQDNRAVGVCGDLMPLNSSFCGQNASATSPLRFNAIATWIAQGALKN